MILGGTWGLVFTLPPTVEKIVGPARDPREHPRARTRVGHEAKTCPPVPPKIIYSPCGRGSGGRVDWGSCRPLRQTKRWLTFEQPWRSLDEAI